MATDNYTDAEWEAEAQRRLEARKQASKANDDGGFVDYIKNASKATVSGMNTGAASIPAIVPMVADVPLEAGQYVGEKLGGSRFTKPMPLTSGYFGLLQDGGLYTEQDFPGYEGYFRFGEGAAPGMLFGAKGGLPGMASGAILSGGANMAAKGLFPNSPLGQMVLNMGLPIAFQSGANFLINQAAKPPKNALPPMRDPDTGVYETRGQMGGNTKTLAEETRVANSLEGYPHASRFGLSQADDMESFLDKVQKFSSKNAKNMTDQQISDSVWNAFKQRTESMLGAFKQRNQVAFDKIKTSGVDTKAPTIDASNAVARIDKLIAEFDHPEVMGSQQSIVRNLKALREQLTSKPSTILGQDGKPLAPIEPLQKMSLEQLQQNMTALGEAAYKGVFPSVGKNGSAFADVSPGTVKYIARQVLGGLRNDLDAAATSGTNAGAKALEEAKVVYKLGLDQLDDFAQRPLVRFFNKTKASALTPELVVKKMTSLPPSQQNQLMDVLNGTRPDLVEAIRYREFQQILDKARIGSKAPAGSPKFDLNVALEEIGSIMDNKPKSSWLFPTKDEVKDVKLALAQLQRINQRNQFGNPNPYLNEGLHALQTGVGVATGAKGRYFVDSSINTLKALLTGASNEKLAMIMFDPTGRRLVNQLALTKTNPREVLDLWESSPKLQQILLGKTEKGTAMKTLTNVNKGQILAAPALAQSAMQPKKQIQETMDSFGNFTDDEWEAEARRRGLVN